MPKKSGRPKQLGWSICGAGITFSCGHEQLVGRVDALGRGSPLLADSRYSRQRVNALDKLVSHACDMELSAQLCVSVGLQLLRLNQPETENPSVDSDS